MRGVRVRVKDAKVRYGSRQSAQRHQARKMKRERRQRYACALPPACHALITMLIPRR